MKLRSIMPYKATDEWADFGDFKIFNSDLATYVKKHLRLIDRFNIDKIISAATWGFSDIQDAGGKIDLGNWKFVFDKKGFCYKP